jgi:hypothetical protein
LKVANLIDTDPIFVCEIVLALADGNDLIWAIRSSIGCLLTSRAPIQPIGG